MPLYEYECDACGRRFEVIRKFSDPPVETCKECGKGPVRRLPSSPAIQFKGSGWYITDYAQKGKSDPSSTPPAASSDAKPDAGGEKKTDTGGEKTTGKTDAAKSDTSSATAKAKESKD